MRRLALPAIITIAALPAGAAVAWSHHHRGHGGRPGVASSHHRRGHASRPWIIVDRAAVGALPGKTASATVISRAPRTISVHVRGLPVHAWTTVKPSRLRSRHRSRLVIGVSLLTPPGRYRLVVSGVGDAANHHRRLWLVVKKASFVPAAVAGSVPTHIATWAYDDGCNG